jgi:hypothetical protein
MTTMVKRSSVLLGAVALVVSTAALTTLMIGTPVSAARPYAASESLANSPLAKAAYASTSDARANASQRYREVTIPAGTRLSLRLGSSYSSASSRVEQGVTASVVSSVHANGVTAIPAGSRVSGVVTAVERPGRVKGRGVIGLAFHNVTVDGERYPIAAGYTRVAPATKKRDAAKIGIPAAGGAVIGAILGGKKGALKGALVGGGAGTAVVLSTRGKDAYIGSGSVIGVTLRRALTVRVPL